MDNLLETALSYEEYVNAQMNTQADQSALRYVFCPFDKMLIFSPTGIPPLEAGRIHLIPHLPQVLGAPYLALYFRERPFDAREVNYNPATQSGEIRISPAPTVDQLTSVYRQQGAIQVTSLFNLNARTWAAMDLNGLIFEGKAFTKPESYLQQFDRVRERVAGMKAQGAKAEFIEQAQRLVPRVLEELERSVMTANGWAKQRAEEFNSARANGELKKFSPFERKVFEFASVTPHDQAINEMATNQNAAITALPALVESLLVKQQAAQPVIDWKELGRGLVEGLKEAGVVVPAQPAVKPDDGKKGK